MTKQVAFAKKYAQAAIKQGFAPKPDVVYKEVAPNSDLMRSWRLLDVPVVKEVIACEILKHNTPAAIANDIRSLRKAKSGVYFQGIKTAEEKNWTARATGLQIAMRALSVGADAQPVNQSINFNVSNLDADTIKTIADSLAAVSKTLNNSGTNTSTPTNTNMGTIVNSDADKSSTYI